jgi:hypothetical protein
MTMLEMLFPNPAVVKVPWFALSRAIGTTCVEPLDEPNSMA